MSDKKYKKEDCIILLKNKYESLQAQGILRYPQRSDFSDREVVAIKAFLGPWPRALEAAGIKPPKENENAKREKRIQVKRARISAIKAEKSKNDEEKNGE